jgi:hypothetical protein
MLVRLWSIGTLAGRSGILWSWFFKNLKDVSDLKRSCVRLTLLSGKTLRRGIKEIAEIKSQSYNGLSTLQLVILTVIMLITSQRGNQQTQPNEQHLYAASFSALELLSAVMKLGKVPKRKRRLEQPYHNRRETYRLWLRRVLEARVEGDLQG